jgi:ferredoxin-like protein FixX
MSTKIYTGIPDEQKKRTKREKKIHTARPAGLKTWRGFSYTIIAKKNCLDCAVGLCTIRNA